MVGIEKSSYGPSSTISGAVNRIQEWVEKLSSGSRLSSAMSDPAGMGIVEKLRAELAEMRQGTNNLSDGLSFVQTAEASAGHIQSNLERMNELAAQASTGTYSNEQKQLMQHEFDQLADTNDRIAKDTQFNGMQVHKDGFITIEFGNGKSIEIKTQDIGSVEGDLIKESNSVSEKLQTAIQEMSSYRGALGATSSRLEDGNEAVATEVENLTQTVSRISDLDTASAVAAKTTEDIVTQSAVASQVHADSFSQEILKLLG